MSGTPARTAPDDIAGVAVRAMAWMALGGFLLVAMNALMRKMTLEMDSLQAQFLRYFFGLAVMLPLLFRDGLAAYRPKNIRGQWWRGAAHTAALTLFFLALPHVPLAEMTAIRNGVDTTTFVEPPKATTAGCAVD